jgi:mRNA interferase MazF
MKRGDLVTVAIPGDFGKPRPALIVRADHFSGLGTVTVLLITSMVVEAPLLRIDIQPNEKNGLQKPSQIMIDKMMTVRKDKLGPVFGSADDVTMLKIGRTLAVFLGVV